MACEVFKIVNDLSPFFISNLVAMKHSQYSMRRINSAFIPKALTTKYGLKSFAHGVPGVEQSAKQTTNIRKLWSVSQTDQMLSL